MSKGHRRKEPVRRSDHGRARPARHANARTRWGALALLLVALLAASLAPIGQASGGGSAAKREAVLAARQSEREERAAAKQAERAGAREQRGSGLGGPSFVTGGPKDERENDNATIRVDCTQVQWEFRNFSASGLNTIEEVITIRDQRPARSMGMSFSFHGSSQTQLTPITGRPGRYIIDARARWKTNGLKGGFDIHLKVICPPAPALAIEKLQHIAGSGGPFVSTPLTGSVGETVDYEMLVRNTGNVPLSLEDFSDPHCDAGTISGGPGVGEALAVGAVTSYMCEHLLDAADEAEGFYENTAVVFGTAPPGEGYTHAVSNTVVVDVPPPPPAREPALALEKLQRIEGSGSFTTAPLSGHVGQKVEYEVFVTNTGNVPLTLSSFSDPHCDAGTIAGGPGAAALPPGAETTYTCDHVLDGEDLSHGTYYNTAGVTGTPPEGEGSPTSKLSNTVSVALLAGPGSPGNGTPGTPGTTTPGGTKASSGVLATTSGKPGSGTLAFVTASAPKLIAPQGCLRGGEIKVSIKSASVLSVTFYLDGRKVRTLTAKNAHKGLLTIEINSAALTLGGHTLAAKITMAHPASVKATQTTRRATLLRCRPDVVTPKFTG